MEPKQPPIHAVRGWNSLGVKRPGDEVDHSYASAFEIKSEQSCISSNYAFAFKACISSILYNKFLCLGILAPHATYFLTVLYDTGQFVDKRLLFFYWAPVANAPNVLQPYWLIVLPLDVPPFTASLLL